MASRPPSRQRADARASLLDAAYTRRGATARSWVCDLCGADIDSAALLRHLDREHGLRPLAH